MWHSTYPDDDWDDYNPFYPDDEYGMLFDVCVETDGGRVDLTESEDSSLQYLCCGFIARQVINDPNSIVLLGIISREGYLTNDSDQIHTTKAKFDSLMRLGDDAMDRDYRTRCYATILGDCDTYMLISDDGSFDVVHLDENYDIDDVMTYDEIVRHGTRKPTDDDPCDVRASASFHEAMLRYEHRTGQRYDDANVYTLIDGRGTWKAHGPWQYIKDVYSL